VAITADVLVAAGDQLRPGRFVVLRTGWDRWWGAERYFRHPYLSLELADGLVTAGVSLVAIDTLNVDSTVDGTAAAHERLLGNNVLIVENLRGLDALAADRPYLFVFAPLALGDVDGAPVRALAWDAAIDFGALDPRRSDPTRSR
jgi:kynurenine formamidase